MKKTIILIIAVILVFLIVKQLQKQDTTTNQNEGVSTETTQESNDTISETTTLEDGNYTVIESESELNWVGKMGTVKSHTGTFGIQSGDIILVDSSATGEVVIDMNDITSDSDGVNGHLKSDDFFAVETYPTSTFMITGFDGMNLDGELTVKDQTHPISIPVSVTENEGMYALSGSFDFDRSQWDVRYGSTSFFDDLGDKAIDNIVPITFTLTLSKDSQE